MNKTSTHSIRFEIVTLHKISYNGLRVVSLPSRVFFSHFTDTHIAMKRSEEQRKGMKRHSKRTCSSSLWNVFVCMSEIFFLCLIYCLRRGDECIPYGKRLYAAQKKAMKKRTKDNEKNKRQNGLRIPTYGIWSSIRIKKDMYITMVANVVVCFEQQHTWNRNNNIKWTIRLALSFTISNLWHKLFVFVVFFGEANKVRNRKRMQWIKAKNGSESSVSNLVSTTTNYDFYQWR